MGIYERNFPCGCVGISTTHDMISTEYFGRRCEKHASVDGGKIRYNLKPSLTQLQKGPPFPLLTDVPDMIDMSLVKAPKSVKIGHRSLQLFQADCDIGTYDISRLDDKNKILFSEFGDDPSWRQVNGSVYRFIIEHEPRHEDFPTKLLKMSNRIIDVISLICVVLAAFR
jgi:hypothetical protein